MTLQDFRKLNKIIKASLEKLEKDAIENGVDIFSRDYEETKRKISESGKGKTAWNKGLPGTWVGKTHSEESKRKISISKKGQYAGEKNPMFGKSAVAGRKWYNDGVKTYYLFPDDPATMTLILGRLK